MLEPLCVAHTRSDTLLRTTHGIVTSRCQQAAAFSWLHGPCRAVRHVNIHRGDWMQLKGTYDQKNWPAVIAAWVKRSMPCFLSVVCHGLSYSSSSDCDLSSPCHWCEK